MLTIALPKGRIAKDTLEIFSKVFKREFVFNGRELILKEKDFTFLLVRNQDVPSYVEYQAADIGVVGLDVLEEKSFDLLKLLDLKIGKCKLCVGKKINTIVDYNKPEIKVATKFENLAKNFFAKKAISANIIKLYGSIELAPLVGLSDVIVDIVETGNTMRENGLEVDEIIMESSAYLIANKNSFIMKKSEILSLYSQLNSQIKESTINKPI